MHLQKKISSRHGPPDLPIIYRKATVHNRTASHRVVSEFYDDRRVGILMRHLLLIIELSTFKADEQASRSKKNVSTQPEQRCGYILISSSALICNII